MAKCKMCERETPDGQEYCARDTPPEGVLKEGDRCQEAHAFLSNTRYFPCSQPATRIVFHEKDKRDYAMCDPCADHNVRNRGGTYVI